jgi:hypothetical protein
MPRSPDPASHHRNSYGGVVADPVDFRDRHYVPGLVEVPQRIRLDAYRAYGVPILDQGNEPACTGFGLATVAHYLLRRRKVDRDETRVSPRMFYEMAKRYDEWAGEQHQGSSCRGAVKGWDKHGICSEKLWPYLIGDDVSVLTEERGSDALTRPLGAYFRVGAKDLAAMHSALAEVGILYVMAGVHEGWHNVAKDGSIPWPMDHIGAHAFAIVAYDEHGFWVQNSKGPDWGLQGFARLSYEDWLANGQDVWIVRLGVPIAVRGRAAGDSHGAHAFAARRPYVVSLSKEGRPRRTGTYATSRDDIMGLIGTELPGATKRWKKQRVVLYAPSGLGDPKAALQRFDAWREMLLQAEIYPLMLDWASGFAPALGEILAQAKADLHAKSAGKAAKSAAARDRAADRLDKALTPVVGAQRPRRRGDDRRGGRLARSRAASCGARGEASQGRDPSRRPQPRRAAPRRAGAAAHRNGSDAEALRQDRRARCQGRELHALGAGLPHRPVQGNPGAGDQGRRHRQIHSCHAARYRGKK